MIDKPALHLLASKIYAETKHPASYTLGDCIKREPDGKIRIGYYSADFRNHAITHLMAGIFELHDKSKFELIAFSFGSDKKDEVRQRVAAAFDHFLDVSAISDQDVAQLTRSLEVDIAINLMGFTQYQRTGIFTERCAPIQVNYLGYPGTMGAPYIDYIIADKQLIPEQSQSYYSEKIAYLPDSYLPTSHQVDSARWMLANKAHTRSALGLPDSGFVFCCFNNNFKITPNRFDSWMRILKQVENSVLWLFEENPAAAQNLQREAKLRSIDKHRLIFAKRVPQLSDHLSRYRAADLFLDTSPYNAHTTASDALWMGLPVLTCMGHSFASRVAGSLLNALELPELITHTQQEYEATAIELATHPDKLSSIKLKLEKSRLTSPLFDSETYTRNLEKAYMAMYDRYYAGLSPEHIYIK